MISWQRPVEGWVTCNVDASFNQQSGQGSFGCILRDEMGSFIAGYGGKLGGVEEAKMAEVLGFREAISWVRRLRIDNVFIELDSLAVVNAFRKLRDESYFGSIVEDCRVMITDLRSYSVYFIRRSANIAAHTIAREAYSLSNREEWFSVPSFLINVLLNDNQ